MKVRAPSPSGSDIRERHSSTRTREVVLAEARSTASDCSVGASRWVIVVDFEQQAAVLGFERAMIRAGRAARVGHRPVTLAAPALFVIADGQVAGNQEHLFPVRMNEGRDRIDPGVEPQQAGTAAGLRLLVQSPR